MALPAEAALRHHGDAELAPGLVDLAVNVRPGTPPEWLAAVLRASVTDVAAYPDPGPARAALADRHGRPEEEVLVTAGAAEAFVLLARALAPRHIVAVHPQFTEPEAALRAAGHPVDRVLCRPERGFRLDPAEVPHSADLVLVGNPTNPTSALHPPDVLATLARPGRTLVVDEAFADTVPGEAASLAARRDLPGLVVVRSLTKTWGLAGLRVGYVLAGAAYVRSLAAVQPLWAVSSPALVAAVACAAPPALAEADTWARELRHERARLVSGLRSLGLAVAGEPSSSFALVQTPPGRGHQLRLALRGRGFAVRRGDTFPGLGPDWLRVAVRPPVIMDPFLTTLGEVLG